MPVPDENEMDLGQPLDDFEYDHGDYYKRHRLSNGQFCQVWFLQYKLARATEYTVAFAVADKKRDLNAWIYQDASAINFRTTGKCGLEALKWCKDQILNFEDYLRSMPPDPSCRYKITVAGEDSRRFRAYEWALSKCGYQKAKGSCGWLMYKFIEPVGRYAEVTSPKEELYEAV